MGSSKLNDVTAKIFEKSSINCTESGSPNSFNISSFVLPAEEYFNHHLLQLSSGIEETGDFNWGNFIGLVIIWTLTALCLIKGVKWIGRISYITATLPYLIIGILFVRGVTLDGAINGLNFYLFKPNFEKLWIFETWIAAATQMCFSLSIGFGGLLSLASYNKRNHNFYRDALIVIFCDSFMSIFGGCAVFSIMGFLSKHTGRDVTELIEGGLTQGFVTALVDQMPFLLPRQWIVVTSVCFVSFIAGLSMCTQVTERLLNYLFHQKIMF
uniref:Sodium-dependent neutral amino acid transporter SLC6A17 n=1 Tax=Heterorhabditis bacteriophora TaxID=37862 RepID=A0A1I7XTL3_HETBA